MSGLDPFWATFNTPGSVVTAHFGDSTTEGKQGITNGGWVEQIRVLADPRWQRGGDGCHPVNRDPWALTTAGNAWTIATTSDTWDCAPMLGTQPYPAAATYLANGSAKIATWTKPSGVTAASFTFFVVDGASAGNFSYSLDGGSNWTNVSATWAANNTVKRIRVAGPVTSTIKVRAANAAGTAVNVYLVGGKPNTANQGFVAHNLGADGEFLFECVRSTAGNWHAWLDSVQPALCTIMFTNDAVLFDATAFEAQLRAFADVVTGYGGCVLFLNFFEQQGRETNLAAMRAITKTVAADYGMPVVDFYDLVGGGYSVANGLGYMADTAHASNTGCVWMAQQVWNVIAKPPLGAKFRS